jgi:hypothetical protein
MGFIAEFSICFFTSMVIIFGAVCIGYMCHVIHYKFRRFFWAYGDFLFWTALLSFSAFGGYNFYLKYGEEILNYLK